RRPHRHRPRAWWLLQSRGRMSRLQPECRRRLLLISLTETRRTLVRRPTLRLLLWRQLLRLWLCSYALFSTICIVSVRIAQSTEMRISLPRARGVIRRGRRSARLTRHRLSRPSTRAARVRTGISRKRTMRSIIARSPRALRRALTRIRWLTRATSSRLCLSSSQATQLLCQVLRAICHRLRRWFSRATEPCRAHLGTPPPANVTRSLQRRLPTSLPSTRTTMAIMAVVGSLTQATAMVGIRA
ncbi:hypothetical protein GGH13_005565, partial [Coemansia sp. S155-1]